MKELVASESALILIDLMPRIVSQPLAPRSGEELVATCISLASAFRAAGATVVLVRVERPNAPTQPPGSEIVDELQQETDVVVVKHTIGAFHETDLHAQLQERDVRILALAGVATNMGVESTGRSASDYGYELMFVEDAMSALTANEHAAALTSFSRFGEVATAAEVVLS
jgi:nicotinamidase-related amidase